MLIATIRYDMVDCLNFLLFSRNQKSELTKKFPPHKSILVIRFCFQLRISQATLFKTRNAVQTKDVKENVLWRSAIELCLNLKNLKSAGQLPLCKLILVVHFRFT